MHDVLIIGGGVIGLSLAWELAKHGRSVHVIDQSEPGREASWAGAGILPAASSVASRHPYEQLRGMACKLHPRWAAELRAVTGIDTGYRNCGGLHLARTPGEVAALTAWAALVRDEGISIERLSTADVQQLEPGIAGSVLSTQYRLRRFTSETKLNFEIRITYKHCCTLARDGVLRSAPRWHAQSWCFEATSLAC